MCWSGPNPLVRTDDGCATSDLLAGIDQAVKDGVDVINYSIGGGAAQTTVSPTDQAFLGAAAAGVFVSASAGNSGPAASTLDNASPWITTVAASTIPSYEATVTLGDGSKFGGASVSVDRTAGVTPLSGPLVTAASVALAGGTTPSLCVANSLDPAKAAGKIVVCERGTIARLAKSAEVKRAGGIGMVLVNVVLGSTDLDPHTVPTVHLDAQYHNQVLAYAATAAATATFTPDNTAGDTPPTPIVAGFSSRVPVLADGSDILKPDISAPGVAIIADGANAAGEAPTFQFLSGTSMAAPHISGLGLLYLGEHPTASPAEIKSAMMTTAYDTKNGAGAPVTDLFTQGAGHADPTKYFAPGLLYLNGLDDWYAYIQGAGYDVGWRRSIRATSTSRLSRSDRSPGRRRSPARSRRPRRAPSPPPRACRESTRSSPRRLSPSARQVSPRAIRSPSSAPLLRSMLSRRVHSPGRAVRPPCRAPSLCSP